jgi:hypothetical protein
VTDELFWLLMGVLSASMLVFVGALLWSGMSDLEDEGDEEP